MKEIWKEQVKEGLIDRRKDGRPHHHVTSTLIENKYWG